MDKWLRQSQEKRKSTRNSNQPPMTNDRELQQVLEKSRLEIEQQDNHFIKDLETATRLSLNESSLHGTTLHTKRTTLLEPVQYENDNDDTWAVDSFLNTILDQPCAIKKSDSDTLSNKDNATRDDDDWEIRYESTTDDDEQADIDFFGQLRREVWNVNDIRKCHAAAKKRSLTNVIKKNKRPRTQASDYDHNYYTTTDDTLDGDVAAAGFGDTVAGLSWEGMGQSRYA
ncbi:hypothetical protein BC941DRAFT_438359 [Chlamydoabsidia padenii]|nr:hypothetical protein BC941DRAFT_438359 [Chlamydoabsidia padenii]